MNFSVRIIRHHRTYPGSSHRIARDVRISNPDWVHEQLGTESEADLQAYIDQLNPMNWYMDGEHLGPDSCGLMLVLKPEE